MDELLNEQIENVENKEKITIKDSPKVTKHTKTYGLSNLALSFVTFFSLTGLVLLANQNNDLKAKLALEEQKWEELYPYLSNIKVDLPIYEGIKKNIINESGVFSEQKLTYIVENYMKGESIGGNE